MIEFAILGPLAITVDAGPIPVAGSRRRAVLLRLLVAAGQVVPTDRLIEDVWEGQPPEGASGTLRSHVSFLRRTLGDRSIRHAGGGYLLDMFDAQLDSDQFESELFNARIALSEADSATAEILLDGALRRWRGDALSDVAGAPWAIPVATRLEELRLAAVEDRLEALLSLGRDGDAVAAAESAVIEHPLRERLWTYLMLGLYRSGRQAEAIRAFQRMRTRFAEDLGLEPSRDLVVLESDIIQRDPRLDWVPNRLPSAGQTVQGRDNYEPNRSLDNRKLQHNLPVQLSRFIGRETELSAVRALLESHRLVTLVGAGGSGKTRLALQVAPDLLDSRDNGVWLVEFASLTDPDMVGATVAAVLEVSEESGQTLTACLVERLRNRSLLLVFDNCEHLLDACAQLAAVVLRSCPGVAILATSRQALGVAGELVHRVPSLAVPPIDAVEVAEVGQAEAVQLFVDRACLHERSFALERSNAGSIARICRRLDGIPLAVELAAARLGSVSAEQIETRLDDRFRLLTGGSRVVLPRQQTLRALVDWSYDLLSEEEQAVLCRLSVFNGGFDLSTAAGVCSPGVADEWEMLDHLTALVDKSLVQVQVWGEEARYSVLETIRHYAWDRLVERGLDGLRRLRDSHAVVFSALAVRAATHHDGPDQRDWLARLDLERDNLRNALSHLVSERRGAAAAELAASLGWYWLARAHYQEGIDSLGAVLAQLPSAEVDLERARVLLALARLHAWQGDLNAAMAASDDGLAIARDADDPSLVAELLLVGANARRQAPVEAAANIDHALALARQTADSGLIARILIERAFLLRRLDRPGAECDLTEALDRLRDRGDTTRLAQLLNNLGYIALETGQLEKAGEHFSEAHQLAESLQHTAYALLFTLNLGLVAILQGDIRHGEQLFSRVLEEALRADERGQVPYALFGLALCSGSGEEDERATTLHGAAGELLRTLSQELDEIEAKLQERDLRERRQRMGEALFLAAYEAGCAMSQDEAARVALRRA